MSKSPAEKLLGVRLLAMDVDGVLTDGRITYTPDGDGIAESKTFHAADGLGIQIARHGGLIVVWISGRGGAVLEARARELKVDHVYQKVSNKSVAIAELMGRYALSSDQIAYVGDDLNDLPAFSVAGVKFAPTNAIAEVKALADFVTERSGGQGAIREVCDVILKAQGRWNDAVAAYLAGLLNTDGAGQ